MAVNEGAGEQVTGSRERAAPTQAAGGATCRLREEGWGAAGGRCSYWARWGVGPARRSMR